MKHEVELKVYEHPACIVPYIDGERLPFCESVDHSTDFESGEGVVKFNVSEYPLSVYMKEHECDLSDYVKIATLILRDELLKHGDLYRGFLASIESSVEEQKACLPYRNSEWIAEEILKRIIGEE